MASRGRGRVGPPPTSSRPASTRTAGRRTGATVATRARPRQSGGRQPGGKQEQSASELEARYVQMNAELEAHAKALLSEAEAVLAGQHSAQDLDQTEASTMEDDTDATIDLGPVGLPPSLASPRSRPATAGSAAIETDAETSFARDRGGERAGGDVVADSEVEQFLLALDGVGEESALRLMKAQLRTMQTENQAAQAELKQSRARAAAAEKEAKQLAADKTKLEKQLQAAKAGSAKHATIAEEAEKRGAAADSQLKALKKELDDLQRAQKKHDTQHSTLQVRLNRAQEELETTRKEVTRLRQSSNSSGGELRGKYDAVATQNKTLLAQKEELLAAFKKQQQLIDILKRQKLHVEAARVLQFSEEEFVKALDWGK